MNAPLQVSHISRDGDWNQRLLSQKFFYKVKLKVVTTISNDYRYIHIYIYTFEVTFPFEIEKTTTCYFNHIFL